MSDYTGPGLYEILPSHAQNMSLNVWGGATTAGTAIKLYKKTPDAKNTQFQIVAAGGTQGKPEIGDREYHIIAGNSGLYVAANGADKGVTTELRAPLTATIRWKLKHNGNGTYCINNVDGKTQLNVRGGSKDEGTEVIMYNITDGAANAQFIFKAI